MPIIPAGALPVFGSVVDELDEAAGVTGFTGMTGSTAATSVNSTSADGSEMTSTRFPSASSSTRTAAAHQTYTSLDEAEQATAEVMAAIAGSSAK